MTKLISFLAPNQAVINDDNKTTFQSYQSIIATKQNDVITLDVNKWDYSKTTLKYLYKFLDVPNKKAIEANIKNGFYQLENLN